MELGNRPLRYVPFAFLLPFRVRQRLPGASQSVPLALSQTGLQVRGALIDRVVMHYQPVNPFGQVASGSNRERTKGLFELVHHGDLAKSGATGEASLLHFRVLKLGTE
jgi:hypothetical protein